MGRPSDYAHARNPPVVGDARGPYGADGQRQRLEQRQGLQVPARGPRSHQGEGRQQRQDDGVSEGERAHPAVQQQPVRGEDQRPAAGRPAKHPEGRHRRREVKRLERHEVPPAPLGERRAPPHDQTDAQAVRRRRRQMRVQDRGGGGGVGRRGAERRVGEGEEVPLAEDGAQVEGERGHQALAVAVCLCLCA